LAASTHKKVLITRFDREALSGFVHPQTYLQEPGVEFMTLNGTVLVVAYPEIKVLYFVREFHTSDPGKEQRLFLTRPKAEGLWVRMKLRDSEVLDGLLANNLLLLDPYGFVMSPPNPNSNYQRMFIPRAAIQEIEVVGVVGSPLTRKKTKGKPAEGQLPMFE
jgi:hypothetical protein